MKKTISWVFFLIGIVTLSGCATFDSNQEIELFVFKPESVKIFESIARSFEEEHPDIEVEVSAPSDAYSVLKTRIIKGKTPDIVGLGGEKYYVDYAESGIFEDLTDDPILQSISPAYIDSLKVLENGDSIHGLPYVANVSGVIYNKDLFEADNIEIPTTWDEFINISEKLKADDKTPFYLGYKDDWTIMQAFNPLGGNLMSQAAFDFSTSDYKKYNSEYSEALTKLKQLNDYSQGDVFSYNYNDATIGFANGESYMYLQGNWAIPMILQTNPDLNIGMFPFPAKDNEASASMSGIDIVFSLSKDSKYPEASRMLLEYLISEGVYQEYLDDQFAVPTLADSTDYPDEIIEVTENLQEGNIILPPQYLYPSSSGLNALIQKYLIDENEQAFIDELNKRIDLIQEQQGGN